MKFVVLDGQSKHEMGASYAEYFVHTTLCECYQEALDRYTKAVKKTSKPGTW